MTLAAIVLAGGESRRFGADKLSADLDGRTLLERVVAALPPDAAVYVVGPPRPLGRPVTWLREEPAGGGPAAAMVAGLKAALDGGATLFAILPGDAPDAARAADRLVGRLVAEPDLGAVVAAEAGGRLQPLQLALRRPAALQLVAASGPGAGANASARALIQGLDPPLATGRPISPRTPGRTGHTVVEVLPEAELWDIDTPEQLATWLDRD